MPSGHACGRIGDRCIADISTVFGVSGQELLHVIGKEPVSTAQTIYITAAIAKSKVMAILSSRAAREALRGDVVPGVLLISNAIRS